MKVKVRTTFTIYLLMIALIDGIDIAGCFLLTLLIHESAHLLTGYVCHEIYASIEFTPFGGIIHYKSGRSACKGVRGIVIALAGPSANYALMYLCAYARESLPYNVYSSMLIMNASMLMINLLPVLPLDGGRVAFCIGYYVFPVSILANTLAGLGMLTGILFSSISVYGLIAMGRLNITLLAGGVYMIACSKAQRDAILSDNLFALIQERNARAADIDAVSFYKVKDDTLLVNLIPVMARASGRVCLLRKTAGVGKIVEEEELYQVLFASPNATIGEAFDQK